MKRLIALTAAVALAASATGAAAKNGKGNGNGNGNKHQQVIRVAPSSSYQTVSCPPGLAKKNPPCVPPGQAKKAYPRYDRGDILDGDYWVIRDPGRYRLDRSRDYAVLGDYVYQIDPQTRKVLNLIGAIADLAQ